MNYMIAFSLSLIFSLSSFALDSAEFERRRGTFLSKLSSDGIAILIGGTSQSRNHDVNYDFRQETNFYYLSGFDEPGAVMVFRPNADKKYILFVQPKDFSSELWNGHRFGVKGAIQYFGADEAYPIEKLKEKLTEWFRPQTLKPIEFYYDVNTSDITDKLIDTFIKRRQSFGRTALRAAPVQFSSARNLVEELRLFKSSNEVLQMQRAVDITGAAIKEIAKSLKPGLFESTLQGILMKSYLTNGARRQSFTSIIATGVNSNTLHYEWGSAEIKDGDLVQLDVGAEYDYYGADVSRSLPANGKFTVAQKEIYEAVLRIQEAVAASVSASSTPLQLGNTTKKLMALELKKLGLINDINSDWQVSFWFPHGVTHWLGMDVHDSGTFWHELGKPRPYEPGMMFTIEPGIYINPNIYENLADAAKAFGAKVSDDELKTFEEDIKAAYNRYKGIGVRIEDDYFIDTKNDLICLSCAIPKTVKDIEMLMSKETALLP